MREGKRLGMLNDEEIALLRQSAREIAEACRQASATGIVNVDVPKYVGILRDKTEDATSLEDIENVIPDGCDKNDIDID